MNVSDGIERMGCHQPTKVAIVADGERITYGELDASANRLARFLRGNRGFQPGERVAILAGNTIEFLVAFYGAVRARCIAVPLSDQWSAAEFTACLRSCQPSLILMRSGSSLPVDLSVPTIEIGSFLAAWDPRPLSDKPQSDDFFCLGYTSGSTGQPKGVLRRHCSWLDSYLAATVEFGCSPEDRVLAPGALFYGLSLFAVTHALFLGSTAYIMSEFNPRVVLELVERERVTTLCMVPTLYETLLNAKGAGKRNLTSVRTLICAGSTWLRAEEAKGEVLSLFPAAGLYEYYGASEMSFVSVSHPEDQLRRPRSVGRPFLGVRVEVRDEAGRQANPGEVGTLYAQSSLGFEGYYGDPKRTATVHQDGWMTVGDLAYADEDGYLYIVGRNDNVVITGGIKVSVEEVEEALSSHPKVVAAAVFGLDDPRRGKVLVALVEQREGADLRLQELRAHCAARLAPFKVPRRLQFVEAIPRTATGKISRPDLPRLLSAAPPAGQRCRR